MAQAGNNVITLSDLNTTINHEPRVLDTTLAKALGFSRDRDIRKIIERNQPELETYGTIATRWRDAQIGSGATRKVTEYFLNEGQAILIAVFSRTPKAAEVRKEVIEVFMAYRRNQLPKVAPRSVTPRSFLVEMAELGTQNANLRSENAQLKGWVNQLVYRRA